MSKVTINQPPECVASLYSESFPFFLGYIRNEYQLADVRLQIKRQALSGYYFLFQNKRIDIMPDGGLTNRPKGFFDQVTTLLDELID